MDKTVGIFIKFSNKSLQTQHVVQCWKDAVVVPVPKTILNDFRAIALTSIVMKTFEKVVRSEILKKVE